MTSIETPDIAAEEFLDLHIKAARQQFDAASLEDATRRLRVKLSRARGRRNRVFSWPSLVGVTSALIVSILAVSLFVPGNDGAAFAQAQQWLSSFRTLYAETTVGMDDTVSSVSIWLDESGDTRVESLGIVTIIKPEAGMIYGLSPNGQNFARPITSETIVGSSTDFLDKIRAFQGNAELLAESRSIEGISAVGYELEGNTGTDILWVDPADGRPLLIETQLQGGATASTVFRFDVPLPENAFEIPDEIQRIAPVE